MRKWEQQTLNGTIYRMGVILWALQMNCDKIKGLILVEKVLQRCGDNYRWKLTKRNCVTEWQWIRLENGRELKEMKWNNPHNWASMRARNNLISEWKLNLFSDRSHMNMFAMTESLKHYMSFTRNLNLTPFNWPIFLSIYGILSCMNSLFLDISICNHFQHIGNCVPQNLTLKLSVSN